MFYVKQGDMPGSRHTYTNKDELLREELFGEESFDGPYSLLYHRNEPTEIISVEEVPKKPFSKSTRGFMHKHYNALSYGKTGSFISGRNPLMYNDRVRIGTIKPSGKMESMMRNALFESIMFVQSGTGEMTSPFGNLKFGKGDYLYIPKGLTFYLDYSPDFSAFYLETRDRISIPARYLNLYGQLKEGSPYYTRDFRYPILSKPSHNGTGDVYVDFDTHYLVEKRVKSMFDVEGWDGYLYPFAVNVDRFSPIVGKQHMPPPVHEHFTGRSFMLGTFLPRPFDFHPKAIPISYYHNNIDTDEVLFYSSGNFMSRKGISPGSITVHVRGIIHGPQPGAVESSIGKQSTDEIAVMIETYDPLKFTEFADSIEDKEYMKSWSR